MNKNKETLANFKYVYYKNYVFRKIMKKEGFLSVKDFLQSRTVILKKNNSFFPIYTFNDIPLYWIIELLNKYKYELIEDLDTGNSYLIPLFLEYNIRISKSRMPDLIQYLYLEDIETTIEPDIYSKICEDNYPYNKDEKVTKYITDMIIYNIF